MMLRPMLPIIDKDRIEAAAAADADVSFAGEGDEDPVGEECEDDSSC